jgi:hypothetical protein
MANEMTVCMHECRRIGCADGDGDSRRGLSREGNCDRGRLPPARDSEPVQGVLRGILEAAQRVVAEFLHFRRCWVRLSSPHPTRVAQGRWGWRCCGPAGLKPSPISKSCGRGRQIVKEERKVSAPETWAWAWAGYTGPAGWLRVGVGVRVK